MAAAAARRRDSLRLPDDGAGGRLLRRHQHRDPHRRDGDEYVINGRKWWSSGVGDPRCKIAIVMGKTDPDGARSTSSSRRSSCRSTPPGIKIVRMLPVFGYDDAPHGHAEVLLKDVRVPVEQPPARRRPRFRDRARPARPGPHPPLHAHGRRCRSGAGEDGQAAALPRRLRQEDRRAFGLGAAHRRSAHRHRNGAAALPQGRRHDGQGRQQGGAARDRHDQGGGAARRTAA